MTALESCLSRCFTASLFTLPSFPVSLLLQTMKDPDLEPAVKLSLAEAVCGPAMRELRFTFLNPVHYGRVLDLIKVRNSKKGNILASSHNEYSYLSVG